MFVVVPYPQGIHNTVICTVTMLFSFRSFKILGVFEKYTTHQKGDHIEKHCIPQSFIYLEMLTSNFDLDWTI